MLSPGAVCVALVVTRHAVRLGVPLDPEALLTGRGGQILGLGKRNVQMILAEYGVTRVLAAAGGRTSRGNMHKMRVYVAWLNANANAAEFDLEALEGWWGGIAEKTAAFGGRLHFSVDPKLSLRAVLNGLMAQASKRKVVTNGDAIPVRLRRVFRESPTPCVSVAFPALRRELCLVSVTERMLLYLVGAKLELVLGVEIGSPFAFVADAVTDRPGDYCVEDVVFHVTTSPGEALLRKCEDNLAQGLRPLIITTFKNVPVAETIAENKGIAGRVEVFDVEQFVASNILELSKFKASSRRVTVTNLIAHYNRLAACENNPALLIKEA